MSLYGRLVVTFLWRINKQHNTWFLSSLSAVIHACRLAIMVCYIPPADLPYPSHAPLGDLQEILIHSPEEQCLIMDDLSAQFENSRECFLEGQIFWHPLHEHALSRSYEQSKLQCSFHCQCSWTPGPAEQLVYSRKGLWMWVHFLPGCAVGVWGGFLLSIVSQS